MYWVRLFRLMRGLPRRADDVALWALLVPLRTWNQRVRYAGHTFADLYGKSVDPLSRKILPLRAFYFIYLLLLPLLLALKGPRRFRQAMRRLDLYASHPNALYTEQELLWARPDYALGMAYAFEFARRGGAFFALDDKRRFVDAARAAGLPLPPMLSVDEAIAEGGTYIVKRATSSLGYGVGLRTAGELEEKREQAKDWIIQRRLQNHASLRAVFGDDAPLSSFRVITQRDAQGELQVARVAIRIGRSGSVVDNTQQGGIWANIDLHTGAIRPGVTKADFGDWVGGQPVRHTMHPDTEKSFVGVKIPWWDEGRALALRAHAALAPEAPTLGWDVALCEDAPVLLEVNVWTVCYDYEPQSDAFTPACQVLIDRLKQIR